MTVTVAILVAVAGGGGAVCRYLLNELFARRLGAAQAWGTWAVNMTGSLALGVLIGLMLHAGVSQELGLVVGGGFLGAYTTFSTWVYESVQQAERRAWVSVMLNLLGSVIAGGVAAAVGLGVAAWLV